MFLICLLISLFCITVVLASGLTDINKNLDRIAKALEDKK